jgi:serine protease inhibitor
LVLINVLYFNGKWKKEFNNKMETQTFFKLQNNPKTRISADYMYGEMSAGYHKTPTGTEIISIPFEDENYSMVFVVPKTG